METRETMDRMGCNMPNCTHDHSVLYLHPICHPHSGLDVSYVKATGALEMRCSKCSKPVCAVLVARGADRVN